MNFNETEVRIIGSLIEKEITTPEYYPLTLNSLVNACNQKSNRLPVTSYDDPVVEKCLEGLRNKGLVQFVNIPGGRSTKYRHSFLEEFKLIPREEIIICELMLRGPQTLGEIKGHSERMYEFNGMQEVEETIDSLMEREPPLIIKLSRQPGQKEARYMHLLSGERDVTGQKELVAAEGPETSKPHEERVSSLEEEVSRLRMELEELRREFDEFKGQFR